VSFDHLDFNFKNAVLKDKVVRQAFALGVDTQEIVNKELGPVTDKGEPLGNRLLLTNQDGYKDTARRRTSTTPRLIPTRRSSCSSPPVGSPAPMESA